MRDSCRESCITLPVVDTSCRTRFATGLALSSTVWVFFEHPHAAEGPGGVHAGPRSVSAVFAMTTAMSLCRDKWKTALFVMPFDETCSGLSLCGGRMGIDRYDAVDNKIFVRSEMLSCFRSRRRHFFEHSDCIQVSSMPEVCLRGRRGNGEEMPRYQRFHWIPRNVRSQG